VAIIVTCWLHAVDSGFFSVSLNTPASWERLSYQQEPPASAERRSGRMDGFLRRVYAKYHLVLARVVAACIAGGDPSHACGAGSWRGASIREAKRGISGSTPETREKGSADIVQRMLQAMQRLRPAPHRLDDKLGSGGRPIVCLCHQVLVQPCNRASVSLSCVTGRKLPTTSPVSNMVQEQPTVRMGMLPGFSGVLALDIDGDVSRVVWPPLNQQPAGSRHDAKSIKYNIVRQNASISSTCWG